MNYHSIICYKYPRIPIPSPGEGGGCARRVGGWGGGLPVLFDNSQNGKPQRLRTYIPIQGALVNQNVHFPKNRSLISFVF